MTDKVFTKLTIPVTLPGFMVVNGLRMPNVGMVEIDVRELGFMSTEELRADPNCDRYIDQAVEAALKGR